MNIAFEMEEIAESRFYVKKADWIKKIWLLKTDAKMNSFYYKQTTSVQYGTLLNLHLDKKKKDNQKCCKN